MTSAREPRRVVVTGVGVVGPCGIGPEAFWKGLFGDQRPGPLHVEDFDPAQWFENPKEARRADRFTQFAIAAAAMAVEAAGGLVADSFRRGVHIGTGCGGIETLETQIRTFFEKGPKRVSPFLVPMMMPNSAAAAVSMRFACRGPCHTVTTACATGTDSIASGAAMVSDGRCDVVLAGSTEAALTPVSIQGFTNMTALSSDGLTHPFSVGRDGFVMAEGAAVVVLEELSHALERGARPMAEILGWASTADAHHITAPSPGGEGAAVCIKLALEHARIAPGDVTQINAHGTGTPLNDAAEASAIVSVFGDETPPVTSTKGVHGHALGAAGALEATAVVLSIVNRRIPPTKGVTEYDPALPELDLVVEPEGRAWEPGVAVSNSFAFGGHNACLVFGPPPS